MEYGSRGAAADLKPVVKIVLFIAVIKGMKGEVVPVV